MIKPNRSQEIKKGVYVTPEGIVTLQTELVFLKTQKRTQVAERIKNAREFGETLENSEYDAALDEQALVENRIAQLEAYLKDAKVINRDKSDVVTVGSTVTIKNGGRPEDYTIVGRVEANPLKRMISNESPLGAALIGVGVGETVEVVTPASRYKVKILQIK
ncbi:transcription elongation factor GreA [Candidatus Daviesbacteria bacterium]|nr:transcription elongation factor GreA [Candidatus Daviesbacteria bacterium]